MCEKSDLIYRIGFTLIPNIGDIRGKKIIAVCGGVEAVFKEKKKALEAIPGIGSFVAKSIINQKVLSRAEEEVVFIEKYGIKPLFYLDKDYPSRLKHCADSPMMLYFKGSADLNKQKVISIVGSRAATNYGKEQCNKLIDELADLDILLVSGLAYGIDIFAHRAAIRNNLPTVAVLAHGLDRIYPLGHKKEAHIMEKRGGLITDFLSNTNPDRENFPARNRIIAGMADATLVVEARKKGGALITADIANSYDRDVFAVPGRTQDALSAGCHYLIKTHKAALVESSEDIKYIMGWDNESVNQSKQQKLFIELSKDEEAICNFLKQEGICGIDFLLNSTKLQHHQAASALLNLEINGIIQCLPGKMYKMFI